MFFFLFWGGAGRGGELSSLKCLAFSCFMQAKISFGSLHVWVIVNLLVHVIFNLPSIFFNKLTIGTKLLQVEHDMD